MWPTFWKSEEEAPAEPAMSLSDDLKELLKQEFSQLHAALRSDLQGMQKQHLLESKQAISEELLEVLRQLKAHTKPKASSIIADSEALPTPEMDVVVTPTRVALPSGTRSLRLELETPEKVEKPVVCQSSHSVLEAPAASRQLAAVTAAPASLRERQQRRRQAKVHMYRMDEDDEEERRWKQAAELAESRCVEWEVRCHELDLELQSMQQELEHLRLVQLAAELEPTCKENEPNEYSRLVESVPEVTGSCGSWDWHSLMPNPWQWLDAPKELPSKRRSKANRAGLAMVDTGCHGACIGEEAWPILLERLEHLGLSSDVVVTKERKRLRAIDHHNCFSELSLQIPVKIAGTRYNLDLVVIEGDCFVVGLQPLQDWQAIINLAAGTLQFGATTLQAERRSNGMLMLDLLAEFDEAATT